jgi:cell division protein FtsQ
MPKQINKKFLTYLLFFILFGSLNNKNLNEIELPKIKEINILGFEKENRNQLLKNLEFLKLQNIFFLQKKEIEEILKKNDLIDKYYIFKKYPATLEVKIDQTKFLAYLLKDGKYFFVGSNGKLIKSTKELKKKPMIFGNFKLNEFFKLKDALDKSNFDYDQIDKLYSFPSGRWDIKLRSGKLLKLSNVNFQNSLELLSLILKDPKFQNVQIIDVRQKNQVITSE